MPNHYEDTVSIPLPRSRRSPVAPSPLSDITDDDIRSVLFKPQAQLAGSTLSRLAKDTFGAAASDAELAEFDPIMFAEEDELVPGLGNISPKLSLVRHTAYLAEKYGIDMKNKKYEDVIEAARRIAALSKAAGVPLKVGDELPESRRNNGELINYSHYDEDINVLSDPGAMGFGGGYSYRGKDPYGSD